MITEYTINGKLFTLKDSELSAVEYMGETFNIINKASDSAHSDNLEQILSIPTRPDKYYAPYIAWAEDNNIVLGFGDGTYRPDEIITREQAAVITKRYMQYKGKTISEAELSYSDKNLISDWALNGVKCCAASRIMIGHTDNTFAPQNQIIRAEFAAVINRLRK